MKSKHKLGLMAAMAAMLNPDSILYDEKKALTAAERWEIKRQADCKRSTIQGQNAYLFGDKLVYAINEKNAIRKAKSKGYI